MMMAKQETKTRKKKKQISATAEILASAIENVDTSVIEEKYSKQDTIDRNYKDLYVKENERHKASKAQIIIDFAKETEDNGIIGTAFICKHLTDVLKDIAGPSWISECLDDKYKDEEQQRRSRAGYGSGARRKKGKKSKSKQKPNNEEEKLEVFKAAQEEQAKRKESEVDARQDSDELWQIDPSTYHIKDLPKYDFAFRGKLIEYLHREILNLKKRMAELEAELKQ